MPPAYGAHAASSTARPATGYTRLLLTGPALGAIGSTAELARDLQPAVIVLEDVDLVAEDRSFGPGSNPVLFDLLDAMDGAAADAALLFVLTTNRADLLEPALAARPGRVDVAIEIGLPDADARERLGALYGRALPLRLTAEQTHEIVERTRRQRPRVPAARRRARFTATAAGARVAARSGPGARAPLRPLSTRTWLIATRTL